jgi:hypothetical protein
MIRYILDNKAVLEGLLNHPKNSADQIRSFKIRLIVQFVLLAVLDVAAGLTAVISSMILQPASPEYYLVQVVTVPFYLPLHIILLITLLDFFKSAVLNNVTNSHPSSDQIKAGATV